MRDVLNLVDVAVTAGERATEFLRSRPPPARDHWEEKGPSDLVTDVDREAERLIVQALRSAVPESTVMGEEHSPTTALDASLTWIVDPLDGTVNFLHGYPEYAVSIAALVEGDLAAGVVVDVGRGFTYRAARGHGAWIGNQRLRGSELRTPKWALVGTGFPFKRPSLLRRYLPQLERVLSTTAGVRRAGAAALDLVHLAAGRFDAFWELHLAPWDVAAGVLLVREAGGVVTNLAGADDVLASDSISLVAAGNPMLHAWLLTTLEALA